MISWRPDGSLSQDAGRADPGARRPDAARGGQDCERPEEGDRVLSAQGGGEPGGRTQPAPEALGNRQHQASCDGAVDRGAAGFATLQADVVAAMAKAGPSDANAIATAARVVMRSRIMSAFKRSTSLASATANGRRTPASRRCSKRQVDGQLAEPDDAPRSASDRHGPLGPGSLPIGRDDRRGGDVHAPRVLRCPCPHCGTRMIVIEVFARGCEPRWRPTPSSIDTS